jgi:hypothetical protein
LNNHRPGFSLAPRSTCSTSIFGPAFSTLITVEP